MSKKMVEMEQELDEFLTENENAKKAAKTHKSNGKPKVSAVRPKQESPKQEPRAPYRIHAMGMKNDVYCKVMQEDAESLPDALETVEKWAEKEDVKEIIMHVR